MALDSSGSAEDEATNGDGVYPAPPLAEAKLFPPRRRQDMLPRPRVLACFEGGDALRLILVSAPPGYGKTTAVREWCAARGAALAWVTLDAGDNDPTRLWTYVATAINRVRDGLGREALQRLGTTEPPLDAAIAVTNGLAAFGEDTVVVMDDFQVLTERECVRSVESFIEQLPPNARLVLVTRADPPLAVGRLRARGELVEVRAADLQFTSAETTALLVEREGLPLSSDEIEQLHARTEGWPAAVVLAGIWLRTVEDAGRSVREFGGDNSFVAELLTNEVLVALDEDTRSFLLRASVLGRFTSRLCDATFDRSDSSARIAELVRANLFVSRLQHGGWFRIHPLFAEYAAAHLAAVDAEAPAAIHRRAAAWLHSQGLAVEAAEHAAAAGDRDLVARLLVEYHLDLLRGGRTHMLLRWVESLPDEHLVEHPQLAVAAATAMAMHGHNSVARHRYLALTERTRASRPERFTPYVEAAVAMVRAASLDGGVTQAVEDGRRAVELAHAEADEVLVAALGGYARALYFAGDLDGAWDAAIHAIEHPDARRRAPGHAFARTTLALVAAARGSLRAARDHAEQAKSILGGIGSSRSWLGAQASASLGVVLAAEGHLAEAERELTAAERFFRDEVATVHHVWLLLLLARVHTRRGRLEEARKALAQARGAMDELVDRSCVEPLAVEVEEGLAGATSRADGGGVFEPPTDAELAVLRHLNSDLTTREIGAELFLSPNTVRSHTRALYRKLGVHSRAEAVARAEAHGLLVGRESSG